MARRASCFCSARSTSHRQKWISRFSGLGQQATFDRAAARRGAGTDRERRKIDWDFFSSVEGNNGRAGWRSNDTLSERMIWQRREFASWLSYYGTGIPLAPAKDRQLGQLGQGFAGAGLRRSGRGTGETVILDTWRENSLY